MTVASAKTNLIERYVGTESYKEKLSEYTDYWKGFGINPYWYQDHCKDQELKETLSKILAAINSENHDNSDIMTDYFDVGYYVDIRFGRWDKPFKVIE
jgi:hypothetical protein